MENRDGGNGKWKNNYKIYKKSGNGEWKNGGMGMRKWGIGNEGMGNWECGIGNGELGNWEWETNYKITESWEMGNEEWGMEKITTEI